MIRVGHVRGICRLTCNLKVTRTIFSLVSRVLSLEAHLWRRVWKDAQITTALPNSELQLQVIHLSS
jgi:hypothetical protein